MFALINYFMQGTPFIYQGEELGMSNARLESISDYVDVETINAYQDLVIDRKVLSKKEFMSAACVFGRDNVRTPMQWNDHKNSGFTTGKPWIPVCANYKEVNVAQQTQDENSVYHFYKSLIKLRKNSDYSEVIQNGQFVLLEPEHKHLFVYERFDDSKRIIIIVNYGNQNTNYHIQRKVIRMVISNAQMIISQNLQLLPYEAVAFEVEY